MEQEQIIIVETNELKKEPLSFKKQLSLFATGYAGLIVISILVSVFIQLIYKYRFPDPIAYNRALDSVAYSTAINVISYFILFMALTYIAVDYFKINAQSFYRPSHILKGIGYGAILLLSAIAIGFIYKMLNIDVTDNDNETSVTTIMRTYPLFAFLAFVIAGPVCEELTYRLGLFDLLKRKSKYLAYIGTTLLFGLIHFNFTAKNITNELLNLPSYLLAGFLFCYIHEKEHFSISVYAHITNNLIAFLLSFFLSGSLINLI